MSNGEFEPQERLHPLSWLFGALRVVRQLLVPLLAAVIYGSRDGSPFWLIIGVVVPLVAGLWQQWFYRYGCGPRGLVIRDGLLFRNVRQIDYARIENVDTERGVLHRLLGVADVKVETSTGGRPEAIIQVISLAAAEELRRQVFAHREDAPRAAPAEAAPASEETLLHLPLGEIVRFGLIDNRGMVVVAAAVGLLFELRSFDRWAVYLSEHLDVQFVDTLLAAGLALQVMLALGALLATFVVTRLLSVVLAVMTLFDFRLSRAAGDLRARYGLFTRVTLTMRLARIQAVHRTETLLHRWFKRVAVRVDLAGDTGPGERPDQAGGKVRWLAPVVEPRRAEELIRVALPHVRFEAEPQWQTLAAGARKRIFRRRLLLWALAAVAASAIVRSPTALGVLAIGVPLAWWSAGMYVRYTRWALTADVLLYRAGWLTRRWIIVPRDRIQIAVRSESPFDRRHGMASVAIDTAGSGARSDTVRIPYLARDVADRLARALYRSAAQERDAALVSPEGAL